MLRKAVFFLCCKGDGARRKALASIVSIKNIGWAHFSVIWPSPMVVISALNWESRQIRGLPSGSLLLLQLYNSTGTPQEAVNLVSHINRIKTQNPKTRIVILTNTARESELLTRLGQEAEAINHNAFVDERVFTISPATSKRFDAVYDAQLSPYKRHYLAKAIPSLALISYLQRPSPDLSYAKAIRSDLSHATWINDPLSPNYRRLSYEEVGAVLNFSRVGLCLSEVEGAMYASAQYLMCGLPVVTTPNRGGRDEFFEPDFALTVEPTTEAVAAGVVSMIRRAPSAEQIRTRTIVKAEVLRKRFVDLVQDHLYNHGVTDSFEPRFRSIFFHTLVKRRPLKEIRRG